MTVRPFALFWGGLVAGCLCGTVATMAMLHKLPGFRSLRNLLPIPASSTQAVANRNAGAPAASKREYAFGHDRHRDMMRNGLVSASGSSPWQVRRGLDVERVAGGFTYPINLAFIERPDPAPTAPQFYVSELNGRLKYVAHDGSVHLYADGLLNFTPILQEKSSETGISGLTTVPDSPDLIITRASLDEKSGLLTNEIVRLVSAADGRSMVREVVIKRLEEFTSASNQIQQVVFGPDGMLYVSVGDAENHRISLDRGKYGGKILRMTAEGEPCDDNPWFAGSPSGTPGQYLFAIGLRNVFDFDFQPATARLYGVDNGKNIVRLVEIRRGASYGWNGDFNSTRLNALWTWGPGNNTAPVGMVFLDRPVLGDNSLGRCYVANYGPPGALGETKGKSLWEFTVADDTGLLAATPTMILSYSGTKQATVLGLAQGPDGIYFTDFFGESTGEPESPSGNVWRLVPSKATLSPPAAADTEATTLTPQERGERTFFRSCSPCHRLDGVGGSEGPDLTYLTEDLKRRLRSPGYQSLVARLLEDKGEFFVQQQPRLRDIQSAVEDDDALLRIWLKHHIEEPRFDNPFSKMPSFAEVLDETQREEIVVYLMMRETTPPAKRP